MNSSSALPADTQHGIQGPEDDSREATISVLVMLLCMFCGFLIISYIIHWVHVVNAIFNKKKLEEKVMKDISNRRTLLSIR